MPGVPSGRGCNNCRKSKKKCDEAKPACTRCARRGIECVGAGEKRYKFMEEGPAIARKRATKSQTNPVERKDVIRRVSVNPTNNAALLGQRLIAAVKPQTSLKYNLAWSFGGYLALVPRRLGINEALDAAIDALVTAHQTFSSRKEITVTSLTKYSRALGALTRCIDNPRTASTTETLCAVNVMLLVQHILGPADWRWTGHAEGAAKILKARRSFAPRDPFEQILMMSLRGPVLFEGLFNPRIELTQEEWKELVVSELDANTPEGDMLLNLSQVRDILGRVKTNPDGLAGLLILQAEMRSLYTKTRKICDVFRTELDLIENPGEKSPANPYGLPPTWLHALTQRFYGLAITIALYMHYALVVMRAIDPETAADANHLAFELISIAENAIQYRPFGAGYVTVGLIAAMMTVQNPSLLTLLQSWFDDYRSDFNLPDLTKLGERENFDLLDPFGCREWPEVAETEEHALYDPLLLEAPTAPEYEIPLVR
ncbi:hypothetical protein BDW74DRAFT_103165 [Aspergillus multicolor]|uniref:Zn(II)2Cys6 transcription factor domain-containing protein n=1 Tax=Aspergillus multicolor TaxID=41759 RepID=UPI003CCCAB08